MRTSQSADVADLVRRGKRMSDALHEVLTPIRDGSGSRLSEVLADLEDMGLLPATSFREGRA